MTNKEAIEFLMLLSLEYKPRTFEYTSLNEIIDLLRENEPKKGKWKTRKIDCFLFEECDQCHCNVGTVGMNFCPGCGADMREGRQ